jgi:hypothetical protein
LRCALALGRIRPAVIFCGSSRRFSFIHSSNGISRR